METDNTKLVKSEYDRFLSSYTEDSTLRSSKEAFDRVVEVFRKVELEGATACLNCGEEHPLVRLIFMKSTLDHMWAVVMNVRTGRMAWLNKSRKEALEEMESNLPPGLSDPLKLLFMAVFHIKPIPVTFEELAGENIRPFHIVKFLRDNMDRAGFMQVVGETATQSPASA